MLEQVGMDTEDLYWEEVPPTPKWKRFAADEESINYSISTVKTVASQKKKVPKLFKIFPIHREKETREVTISDTMTVVSQQTSISQLTKQILALRWKTRRLLIDLTNWQPNEGFYVQ